MYMRIVYKPSEASYACWDVENDLRAVQVDSREAIALEHILFKENKSFQNKVTLVTCKSFVCLRRYVYCIVFFLKRKGWKN